MTKRLLFITPLFPKDITEDNVVPFISQFIKKFSECKDVEIDVISMMYPFSSKTYEINNINIYAIGGKFNSKLNQIPTILKTLYKSIILYKKNKYDGVLCFWYREASLIGYLLNKIFKIKFLIWLQGQDAKKNNLYAKLLNIKSDNLVTISENQRLLFNKNFNINVEKVANVFIDPKKFPELNLNYREIDIIGVGNLGALKNFSLFIDIIFALKIENLKVVICGDGEEMNYLKIKIKKLNLENNITFKGYISNEEVLHLLNNSKILLHTSNFEGAGLVLHEALFSGCTVISTIDIENSINIENFFYSIDKDKIISKIRTFQTNTPKRIKPFDLVDNINIIYNYFYKL